jgi:hypothetical protein
MAKRNDMSAAHRSRNRKQGSAVQSRSRTATRDGDDLEPKRSSQSNTPDVAKITTEGRARLMKAQAVLDCVAFTLLYEDWLVGTDRPSFALAIAAAQALLNETLDRLGSCCKSVD